MNMNGPLEMKVCFVLGYFHSICYINEMCSKFPEGMTSNEAVFQDKIRFDVIKRMLADIGPELNEVYQTLKKGDDIKEETSTCEQQLNGEE